MNLIKNINFSEALALNELVNYEEGRVVSRTLAQNPGVSITLFAFASGEGLSTHSAPGDALAHILDGEAAIRIDDQDIIVKAGEATVMPADIPHSLKAEKPFKMMLTVVKKPKPDPVQPETEKD